MAEPEVDLYTKNTDVEDEDCLCMSIWRPTGTKEGDKLPVAFFIHGGGFVSGDSSITWYNGGNLSRTQDMVVVSVNYRLGPLGFLSSDEIEAQNEGGNGGLNGLLDQILALQFVQDNIAYFGGDPEQVAIFGEWARWNAPRGRSPARTQRRHPTPRRRVCGRSLCVHALGLAPREGALPAKYRGVGRLHRAVGAGRDGVGPQRVGASAGVRRREYHRRGA